MNEGEEEEDTDEEWEDEEEEEAEDGEKDEDEKGEDEDGALVTTDPAEMPTDQEDPSGWSTSGW